MEIEHLESENSKQLTKEEHKSVMEVQEEKKNLVLCSYFERYKKAKHQFDIINKSLKDARNCLLRCKVTAKELERMYLEHTGKQIKIKLSTYLQLDMKVKENNDIINELNGRELPKICGVRISNVADSIHIVNNFLKESIPQNLKYIQFNFDSSTEADCENFVDSLCYAARKVTTKVSIYNTNLSSTHFCRILSAFSHCIDVGFYNCINLEEELNLSEIKNSKIYRLAFRNCRKGELNKSLLKYLENLAKGISHCDSLKSSLKIISTFGGEWLCLIGIVNTYGLKHICVL